MALGRSSSVRGGGSSKQLGCRDLFELSSTTSAPSCCVSKCSMYSSMVAELDGEPAPLAKEKSGSATSSTETAPLAKLGPAKGESFVTSAKIDTSVNGSPVTSRHIWTLATTPRLGKTLVSDRPENTGLSGVTVTSDEPPPIKATSPMAAASPHDELDGGGVWRATNPRSRGVTVESDERPLPRWPAVAAGLRRRLASGVLTLDGDEHSRLHLHVYCIDSVLSVHPTILILDSPPAQCMCMRAVVFGGDMHAIVRAGTIVGYKPAINIF
uniref:Uncharacterized protein n=1 Tax=Oryza barthii TaxID=65489 RepID=A0A0D3F407_9ORYZ